MTADTADVYINAVDAAERVASRSTGTVGLAVHFTYIRRKLRRFRIQRVAHFLYSRSKNIANSVPMQTTLELCSLQLYRTTSQLFIFSSHIPRWRCIRDDKLVPRQLL